MGAAENIADLRSILSIVAEETGALKMEDADEDSVGWTTEGPLPMTFGHVRRAHAALAALEAALTAAEPIELRNDDVGFVDFLNSDRPYICRKTEGICYLLIDRETRDVIGYRKYDDTAPPAPSVAVKALQAIVERSYNGELGTSKVIDMRNIALSALSAQVQDVAGWQDISTLEPKDGMIVMGWGEYRERDGFSPAFMRWSEFVGGWAVNALPFYPTHWMPLPAAPAKQEG